MRGRLLTVLTIPIVLLLLSLGMAYGHSLARSAQMELFFDRLNDAGHLANGARQAFGADDPVASTRELERYDEVYGIGALVLDRTGETVTTNGLELASMDEWGVTQVRGALAGRASELPGSLLLGRRDLVVAAPVYEGDELAGVVVTASSTESLARETYLQWLGLLVAGLMAVLVSIYAAARLAAWVLRPIRRVDTALTEIWQGHMDVRIGEVSGPPELRRVLAVFNSMAEEVERLIQQQQEFVWNASHELRNPLNALLLRVEHLSMGLDDDWVEEVERTREEGQRMTRILEALLLLARQQGQEQAREPVELTALVRRRLAAWGPMTAERGVGVAAADAPAIWCPGDAIVLESAFDAVLDNALKFSAPGSTVEVRVGADDGMAQIAVHDRGPGLSPEEISRMTDRFWRSSQHRNRQGSGLGLAIATEFLDSCDGHLHVAPGEDGGLVVALRIPQVRPPVDDGDAAQLEVADRAVAAGPSGDGWGP